MREMKDSGIGWIKKIPGNWNLIRNKYNFTLSKYIIGSKWCETQLLSLTKNGVKEINDGEQTGKVPASLSTYQKVAKNDIIMCLFDLDCSAVFSGKSNYDGMISPAYKCFKCNESLNPEYVDFYFRTVFDDRKYMRYSKNVRYSLASDEFLDLPILVPPIDEQKRIAAYLDEQCKKIDEIMIDIQSQIDTLEDYKKSVISEAVTKGLDPDAVMKDSGISYIGYTPSSWNIRRLKYILQERNERSVDGSEELLSVSQYYGVIPSSENKVRTMQAESLVGYKKVYTGDLVFNKLNPGLARFGSSEYDGITSPDFAVYVCNGECNAQFLQYLLKTNRYVASFKGIGCGVGDGFARLYTPQLYNFFVSLPPKNELLKICKFIDDKCSQIDSIIEDKKAQLETIENYKKSLIYEYVTGKKKVPENE